MVFADLTTLHASALAAAAAAAAAATAAAVNRSGLNLSCGGGGSESSTGGSPRLPSPHTEDESVGAGSMDQPLNLTTKKADGERCDGNRAKGENNNLFEKYCLSRKNSLRKSSKKVKVSIFKFQLGPIDHNRSSLKRVTSKVKFGFFSKFQFCDCYPQILQLAQ